MALNNQWLKKQEREDQRFAMLATIIANAFRDPRAKQTPFVIEDFMPRQVSEEQPQLKPKQSPEEMMMVIQALHSATKKRQK
jgi:hypothetical protein